MVTALAPHRHGFLHWDSPLDPALETLFTIAAAGGYATASFVFDEDYLFKGFADANVAGRSDTLDGAVEWLRSHRSEPFLLWFHSWATHMPYDVDHAARKEWRAAKDQIVGGIQSDSASALEQVREDYCRAVERSSEELLAPFLEELERLGLRDDTALAFLSDHGESWGERFADKHEVKGTFHMHGARLDEEIVQVPLVLSAPGRVAPGVVSSQVGAVDLTPTLLDLAGLPLDGLSGADGRSLLPLLDGRETGDRPVVIAGTDRGALSQLALREPPWKLILHVESGEEEAYRLDLDPRERRSVPDEVPGELRERLYAELERAEQRSLSAGGGGESDLATLRPRLSLNAAGRSVAHRGYGRRERVRRGRRPIERQYAEMFTIRRFEETLLDLFSAGKIAGTTHTCIGQEANAVGVVEHLDPERDVVFSNHRCHGHYLAFTGDVPGLFGEVMGRANGVCGGKGGSQHLCNGNFYSNGVLGSTVPVAAGIALAERERRSGAVTVAFVGDGTLGQGVFYESLNLASLWRLPLLVVVEDNGYAQSTPRQLNLAGDIRARATAFGIDSEELDTTDVTEISEAAAGAVETVRTTGAPFYLVLHTYRFSPHSKGDDTRDPEEIAERRLRDPLTVAGRRLEPGLREELEAACERRLAEALELAERSPIAGQEPATP